MIEHSSSVQQDMSSGAEVEVDCTVLWDTSSRAGFEASKPVLFGLHGCPLRCLSLDSILHYK